MRTTVPRIRIGLLRVVTHIAWTSYRAVTRLSTDHPAITEVHSGSLRALFDLKWALEASIDSHASRWRFSVREYSILEEIEDRGERGGCKLSAIESRGRRIFTDKVSRSGSMRIHYIEPLSRGISRARQALFDPMDVKKWFVVGFTAFLASLADVQVSGGMPNTGIRKTSDINVEDVLYFPQRALEWLGNHPGWAMLIAFALFFLIVFMILITWVSARGKFMFLHNVVRGQALVIAPWYEYRKEGNSFFRWNLSWVVIFFAIAIAYILCCFVYLQTIYRGSGSSKALILPVILAVLGFIAISIVSAFIFVLFRDFVVPIMYRDRITVWEALQKFLPLFFSHLLHFVGYALFRFLVSLLIAMGILICGCVTCCIGFLILAMPYVSAVVLLPIAYAMRAFAVEFLEQFGPEYQVFPKPEATSPQTAPPSV